MSESEYDLARDAWFRKGESRDALDHALEAVRLDDENFEAAHLVALLYLDFCNRNTGECRLAEAERYAKLALEAKADYREATNTLGVVYILQGRYDLAIRVFEPLTQDMLYRTPETAWGNLGLAYFRLGKIPQAIDALKRSVAAQPLFCVGHHRLGDAYAAQNEWQLALQSYEQALAVPDPACQSLQDAHAGRAEAALKLGRLDTAREALARCTALSKYTPTGKRCLKLEHSLVSKPPQSDAAAPPPGP